ncbi:MAG: heparinase II/III family protein, partial [Planctomycetota bacterium]
LDTVLHTGMAWRLTGKREYFERCVRELDAACRLPDWNPSHFLDVAEMATAVGLGLDWLYADLSQTQRERYGEALRIKAIEPARDQLAKQTHWTKIHNNWSQVCGTGIATACAAVAADEAALMASPFADCLRIVEASARFYEPDGGYPEGPGYWDYGTEYNVLGLAVAAGLGRKIVVSECLLDGAAFMAQVRGSTGVFFNFADASPGADSFTAARGWLITRSGDRSLAADLRNSLWERRAEFRKRGGNNRFFALHLLWLPPEPAVAATLPLAAVFRGEQPVAMLRSAWRDDQAVFVGVKGGTPQASHGHMDVGSFVVEALGRCWIHDLGGDDYNLPGYFGGGRWNYFRLNARSHNVILIGDEMQNPRCEPCRIVAAQVDRPPYSVRLDLTPAYVFEKTRLAAAVTRDVSLDPATREIRIRDAIAEPAGRVRWQCMIDVQPALSGNRAVLTSNGRSLEIEISPRGAVWQVEPAVPPTAQERRNDGFQLLFCTLPVVAAPPDAKQPEVVIEVTMRPKPGAR